MKVFKFGGASVKDADGIKNLAQIVSQEEEMLVVVVSALGKTTNALEDLLSQAAHGNYKALLDKIRKAHQQVVDDLFTDERKEEVKAHINDWFVEIDGILQGFQASRHAYFYDQVVSFGELLSTYIVSAYLNVVRLQNEWVDIRTSLITDRNFKEGTINWEESGKQVLQHFTFRDTKCYITQGFIGGTEFGESVTLGREGSDYTGAILANLLNAHSLTIWKDVPGVLNADPRYFSETRLLKEIAYHEAVELAYFGAKVIHPKTIKPLYAKSIPLYVRCFLTPDKTGTTVHKVAEYCEQLPILILKTNQVLITLKPRSFSFVMEDSLSRLFHFISRQRIKVNLIQNSAVSISICVDAQNGKVGKLINALELEFYVRYNENLELLTIRHYNAGVLKDHVDVNRVLVEQKSRHTAHYVMRAAKPENGQ